MKQAIKIHAALLGEKPPSCNDLFADGSMLYRAEKSITPKLKLRDTDRKESLSWILKFFLPGNCLMRTSTHITEAPRTHAVAILACRSGCHSSTHVKRTDPAQCCHHPSSLVVRERHVDLYRPVSVSRDAAQSIGARCGQPLFVKFEECSKHRHRIWRHSVDGLDVLAQEYREKGAKRSMAL